VKDNLLRLATRESHLRLSARRHTGSLDTGGRRGSTRRAVAGERNVQAIGGTVGSLADGGRLARPHGRGGGSGRLGTSESREELLGLGVKLVLPLASRLLAGGFGGDAGIRSRGVGTGRVGGDRQRGGSGGHRVRSVLIRDFFDLKDLVLVNVP
jgi:hypothetical protein